MADPFDFADPFDLLAKIPEKFASEEGIESKKWQERKDAVEVSFSYFFGATSEIRFIISEIFHSRICMSS